MLSSGVGLKIIFKSLPLPSSKITLIRNFHFSSAYLLLWLMNGFHTQYFRYSQRPGFPFKIYLKNVPGVLKLTSLQMGSGMKLFHASNSVST